MDTEAHLRSLNGVNAAICFVEGEGVQKTIIAALQSNRAIDIAEVRTHLKSRLPQYMIPRKSFVLDELPLNKSGKIDRLAIRSIYANGIVVR